MLHFKVKEMLLASGKKYPAGWLIKHCGFTKPKAYRIINGKQDSINLSDFSMLCKNLHCTPNDLLYWVQPARNPMVSNHPCLTELKTPDKNGDWFTLFKTLTPDRVAKLHQQVMDELSEK